MRNKLAVLGGVAALGVASMVKAAPGTPSIGINFAADEPIVNGVSQGSAVTGPAGVLNTVVWNNLTGANGTGNNLNADNLGVSTPTAASVTWASNNTWSSTGDGEENNTAPPGPNRNLMSGYLDSGNGTAGTLGTQVSITVSNLPVVSPTYDVYVYIQGGANGRGGPYTIAGQSKEHAGDSAFNGTFVEDTIDPGTTPGSNYLVFHGLTGTSFTLSALASIPATGTQRAGVNAIEIVAVVPEPGTMSFLGLGAGALLGRRRRA